MTQQHILEKLQEHRDDIQLLDVQSLALFGSYAKNSAHEESDVDILVEFSRPVGLFHFARVRRQLSEILDLPVDLVTLNALPKLLQTQVLGEAIHAI